MMGRQRNGDDGAPLGPPGTTIALCMIVRNEAAILPRCLRSVRHLIDAWVICDTGSSDETCDVIARELAAVPGELHESTWVDFGHNRSELLELARGSADYLLLLDADMTVRVNGPFPELAADAYLLRETGSLDFGVIRLVRGDRTWWYVGSTHEYIASDGQYGQAELPELAIEHHADGWARDDKLMRDVGLLKGDLARDPGNPRAIFYLAQTYRDLGKVDLAIGGYRQRVELGGWDEEVFYANLQEGVLRAEHGRERATEVLLEAWERRPSRAEPLYELARLHRHVSQPAVAHVFAARGLEIPYPADVLFVHRAVYEWGLRHELAAAAASLGALREARAAARLLVDQPGIPASVANEMRLLLTVAPRHARRVTRADGAPRLASLASDVQIGEVHLDARPAWPAFNPSIAATPHGDGLRMIVRTANYQIERGVLHRDGVLHNVNYLLELDEDLAVVGLEQVRDRSEARGRFPSQIQGYEDCRLFSLRDRWYATATVCDRNPIDRREIALLTFEGADIVDARVLSGPGRKRHEKNWMPFVASGELALLYTCGPTVVLDCDPDSAETAVRSRNAAPALARGFRGGSQGVECAEGQLFVVHEVVRAGSALRYLHRLVLLDREMRLAAVTPSFTFTTDRVEFCAGMARRNDDLVLSFGVSDAAAGLAVLPCQAAIELLEPAEQSFRARAAVGSRPTAVQ